MTVDTTLLHGAIASLNAAYTTLVPLEEKKMVDVRWLIVKAIEELEEVLNELTDG
jgi:hypothetical protein